MTGNFSTDEKADNSYARFYFNFNPYFAFSSIIYEYKIAHAAYVRALPESTGQTLVDPSLKVELTFKDGLKGPITGMAFLGPDDILVLEKTQERSKES